MLKMIALSSLMAATCAVSASVAQPAPPPQLRIEATPMVRADALGPNQTVTAPTHVAIKDGICFLTLVRGQFSGNGEQARLQDDGNGYWEVVVTTGGASNFLSAAASCVKFDIH